jgi:uncharacterized protein YkwD
LRVLAFLWALLFVVPGLARADILGIANAVRAHGCPGRPGARPLLRAEPRLDQAARRLERGERLTDAMSATGYRALASASIHIRGEVTDQAASRALSTQFCSQLTNPAFRDLGAYRSGADLWLITAAPFATPRLADPDWVARHVLELTNAARAHERRCGDRLFAPAAPLRRSQQLEHAARIHSEDMAAQDYLDHIGRDGSTPADRLSRTGYRWRVVGENVAAGPLSAEEVSNGWLASPEHCANIMDPRFTEMGVSYSVNPASTEGVYWTQLFAAPRTEHGR